MIFSFKNIQKIFLLVIMIGILVPGLTFAADPVSTTTLSGPKSANIVPLTSPLKSDSIGGLVQDFIEIFSYVVILGAVLALVWVGLQFILARGNPTKMNELKGWLFYIVIGVAVVIGARLIIQVVINTLSASGVVDQKTIQSAYKAAKGQ